MITKEIEDKVRQDIKDLVQLPDEGIVAGQFVASLFYKHLDLPLNKPLNDVDIFVDNKAKESNPNNKFRSFIHAQRFISKTPSKFNDSVLSVFFRGYSIVKSEMIENNKSETPINIISTTQTRYIDTDSFLYNLKNHHNLSIEKRAKANEKNSQLTTEMIVNNFDLNCCAVGYNIKDDDFFYTDSFVQFLKDFKLRLSSAHSPHSTLIRLVKKVKDLNCNPDIQDEVNFVQLYRSFFDGSNRVDIGKFIYGKPFLSKYEEFKDNEIIKEMIVFDTDRYVSIKNNHENIINGNEGFEKLHEIFKDINFVEDLFPRCFTLNVALNLYYSKIGVIKDGHKNIQYLKKLHNKKEEKRDTLLIQWYQKKIAWLPVSSFDFSKTKQKLEKTLKIEKQAHLVYSLMSHFDSPDEMEEFSSSFLDKNGNYDHVKGELFKYHNKELYQLNNSDFDLEKYKPRKVSPFVFHVKTKEQAMMFDIKFNYTLQEKIISDVCKNGIYVFKFLNTIIPFDFETKKTRNSSLSKFGYFNNRSFNKNYNFRWKNLSIYDAFPDIILFRANDEYTASNNQRIIDKFRYLFIYFVAFAIKKDSTELSKEARELNFKKQVKAIKKNYQSNIRYNKRIAYLRPTLVVKKIREIFDI